MEICISQKETLLALADARPCPFCGCQASTQPWHGGPRTKRMVGCPNIDCEVAPNVTGETQGQALARWNQRAPAPETVG